MGMGGNGNRNGFMGMGGNGNRNSPSCTPLVHDVVHLIRGLADLVQCVGPEVTSSQWLVVWKHNRVVLGVRLVATFFDPRRVAAQPLREPPTMTVPVTAQRCGYCVAVLIGRIIGLARPSVPLSVGLSRTGS